MNKESNALVNESSPYLLQHAYNPVDWMAWNESSLEKARSENKLILLSIGYAACHWCHVMEHESFEDSSVADYMNQHFISIKVDREERPDVDQIYMNALHLMGQRGGWPLNVVCLPNGQPIWGGTYFPKKQWLNALEQVYDFYKRNPDKAYEYGKKLSEGIELAELVKINSDPKSYSMNHIDSLYPEWEKRFDHFNGGKNGAPKFPMPNNYEFLLQYYFYSKEESALKHIEKTLDHMAMGGIYDQLGGGFARYSTDAQWKVPHFEKMLYDNGQLVSLYSKAYQLTKKPLYKEVVYESIGFVERELTDKKGGFYSSLDADSEGEEGKFYIWKKGEIEAILNDNASWFCELFEVKKTGNWEHGSNILLRKESMEKFAKKNDWTREALINKLDTCKTLLMQARDERIRPGLDNKVLTSWNALMLKGCTDAYLAFGDKHFLDLALKNGSFIEENMIAPDGRLWRNYNNGKANINAFLDDYALLIEAYIGLYEASMDNKWITLADKLAIYAIQHFYDPMSQMFFYTSDIDAPLIARKMELSDNVIPASNSSLAKGLFLLSIYLGKSNYYELSNNMLHNMLPQLEKSVPYYSNWLSLALHYIYPPFEVAIIGENASQKLLNINEEYWPNVCFLASKKDENMELLNNKYVEEKTMIYVCYNKACQLPVEEVKDAILQLKDL